MVRLLVCLATRKFVNPGRQINVHVRRPTKTKTPLLKIINDPTVAVAKGKESMFALLDLSSTFNTIHHRILFLHLYSDYDITGLAITIPILLAS